MTNRERAAYVRGLAEGLQLEADKKETKVINALLELVEDMTISLQELEEAYNELADQVDEIDEDLAAVENEFYGDDEDFDCENCGEDCFSDDECYYEVTCPSCKETICLDEQMVMDGELDCPNCGEKLEFDLEDIENE